MFVECSTQYTSFSSRKPPANAGTGRKQFTANASVAHGTSTAHIDACAYKMPSVQLSLISRPFRRVVTRFRVCSFRRTQKRILDPRFARFRGRKEREIRNWICNLGNLSPTRAICTTASQEMTCFLLFDKLCDYTVQNLVVGSSNSDDGTYKTDKERSALKLKII